MEISSILQTNLKILTKIPVDKLAKILHGVIDRKCGRQTSLSSADFVTAEEWFEIVEIANKTIEILCQPEDTLTLISSLGLSPDYEKVLKDFVGSRKEDLMRYLRDKSVADGTELHLKDFDWNLKLTLGSDKMSEMRQPMASLHFVTQRDHNTSTFTLEMNHKELADVIQVLESANKAICQLQTQ
ncbi:COMM domain containing 8 [Chamberlinius hualienensis]